MQVTDPTSIVLHAGIPPVAVAPPRVAPPGADPASAEQRSRNEERRADPRSSGARLRSWLAQSTFAGLGQSTRSTSVAPAPAARVYKTVVARTPSADHEIDGNAAANFYRAPRPLSSDGSDAASQVEIENNGRGPLLAQEALLAASR